MATLKSAVRSLTPRKLSTKEGGQGSAGYDNPRENIDPHIKTKVLDAQLVTADKLKFTGEKSPNIIVDWNDDVIASFSGANSVQFPGTISGANIQGTNIDGVNRITANNLAIDGNKLTANLITPNVGIGTNNPTTKLEVIGQISGSCITTPGTISGGNIISPGTGTFTTLKAGDATNNLQFSYSSAIGRIKPTGSYVVIESQGTNKNTTLQVRGSGTGIGYLNVMDSDNQEWMYHFCSNGYGYIRTAGSSPQNLRLQDTAHADLEIFNSATAGETRELKIHGRSATSGSRKSLQIGVEIDADDTASFDGVSNYQFDGNIISTNAVSGATITGAFFPRRVQQADVPTPAVGELLIWRDSDFPTPVYLVYNDPVSGVEKVELTHA